MRRRVVTWPERTQLCPVCEQPDNSGDCDHTLLSDEEVLDLGGTIENTLVTGPGFIGRCGFFCVEFRVDVEAETPDEAAILARKIIASDGRVTAVFDEDWEEV